MLKPHKKTKPKSLLLVMTALTGLAVTGSTAEAGDYEFEGSLAAGLDNQYNFRGVNFGEKAPWFGADFVLPLNPNGISVNTGVWYINPTEFLNDELDLYAYLDFPLGPISVSVGGIYFAFPEGDSVSGEFGTALGYSLQDYVHFGFAWWADVKGNDDGDNKLNLGHYLELTAGHSFTLTE